jgi:DnaJ-domain-containing protein 1
LTILLYLNVRAGGGFWHPAREDWMHSESEAKLQKTKLGVEMELDGGLRMAGSVFVSQRQRLPDLLNDDRDFLPFESSEGIISIIRKSTIRRVTPLNQVTVPSLTSDPYEILGVAPTISDEELKAVYHRKVTETHPDKLLAMGLPHEFVALGNEKVARINDAYDRIRKLREVTPVGQPKWYHGG